MHKKYLTKTLVFTTTHELSTREGLSSNLSNTKDRETQTSNTDKRVENTTRSRVFLTYPEVFGNVVKHGLECLIFLLK